MELLTVRNLSIERAGRNLLAEVDFTIREGMRMGLIGANGSGKTALLEALAGARPPAAGSVRRAPGIDLGYLPQRGDWDDSQNAWEAARSGLRHLDRLEGELRRQEELLADGQGSLARYGELREAFERAGGYAAEAVLRENLAALGIGDEQLALTSGQLSGGELKRLALARVLASEPQLLLLDEPSNDLDLPALQWLAARLSRWRGGLLLVSHDRELLDRVTTHTAVLKEGNLEVSRGGYSRVREQQGVIRRASERRERERRKEAARLERVAQELRSWGTAKAQRRRRRAERALERLEPAESDGPRPVAPATTSAREAEGRLLEARHLSSVLGERQVLTEVALEIDAKDRVALLGANGSGKSTLLRLLAGEQASDDPRVEFWWNRDLKLLFVDQHGRGLHEDRALITQLMGSVSKERASMLLALSGLRRESWEEPPANLSGGERARAGLAKLLAAEANLLLLDEPTNDLDLEAIEKLQHTLEATEAAFIVATHDMALARLATRVWAIEDGRLVEYRGGLEGYLAGRRRLEPGLGGATELAGETESGESAGAISTDGSADDELERLELERSGVEARLDDPLRLADRERQRLEGRHREIIDLLSVAYDARLSPPLPAFSVREGGIEVRADLDGEGLRYSSGAPVAMRLLLEDGVGHLTLREEEGACLLPWARSVLVDAAVRLAFYALAPEAVQYHSRDPLRPRLLDEAGMGWWTIERRRFEALEGWYDGYGGKSSARAGRPAAFGAPRRFRTRGRRRSNRSAAGETG